MLSTGDVETAPDTAPGSDQARGDTDKETGLHVTAGVGGATLGVWGTGASGKESGESGEEVGPGPHLAEAC